MATITIDDGMLTSADGAAGEQQCFVMIQVSLFLVECRHLFPSPLRFEGAEELKRRTGIQP